MKVQVLLVLSGALVGNPTTKLTNLTNKLTKKGKYVTSNLNSKGRFSKRYPNN